MQVCSRQNLVSKCAKPVRARDEPVVEFLFVVDVLVAHDAPYPI